MARPFSSFTTLPGEIKSDQINSMYKLIHSLTVSRNLPTRVRSIRIIFTDTP